MPLTEQIRTTIRDLLGALRVAAGITLVSALSWEIIHGDHIHFSQSYLAIQFTVCCFFLVDILLRWAAAEHRSCFLLKNALYILISVPWLNIIVWSGAHLPHEQMMLIGLIPLLRAFLAFYIVVRWLIDRAVSRLFAAYILTVVVFTYLSALVFYDYEILVNPKLNSFGDALWWAWMNVTTVGAEIFAVTAIGKIVTVLLPSLGMMMFPIFTTYIIDRYSLHASKKKSGQ